MNENSKTFVKQSFLDLLTKDDIMNKPLPLSDLLFNSLYYPSSSIDGGVIKYCNTKYQNEKIVSFIYVDYSTEEKFVFHHVNRDFYGYSIFAHRSIDADELDPNYDPNIQSVERFRRTVRVPSGMIKDPYCHWFVMEREDGFGEEHGPARFSLLFICGEGVATYMNLYNKKNIVPKAVAIIQPGHAFGGNWTNFGDYNEPFATVMRANPKGMPQWIFYGGMGRIDTHRYDNLKWDGYSIKSDDDIITNYYGTRKWEGILVLYRKMLSEES